jgi:pimeloyl-ACP methyl ester carboxylesterase
MNDVTLDSGLRLATVDRGSGRPLLLVHGFPLDHSMWNDQLEPLATEHRVIAPDLRGFGASQVAPSTATMEQFADDLAELLAALQVAEPVVFCGLSMGGYVGWQFWRRHRARLAALVACDTRAVADSPEAAAGRRKLVDEVLRGGSAVAAAAMLPKLFAPQFLERFPERVAGLCTIIERNTPEGIAAALRGMAERPDVTGWLGQIDVPTQVIVGEHDVISTADEMRSIAAAIPGARLTVIPDAGHMTPVEQPERFSAALAEFLRGLP